MVWASLQLIENLTTEGFSCMCKKGAPHRQHMLKHFLTGDAEISEISGLPEGDISLPHTSPLCPPRLSPSIALHPLEKCSWLHREGPCSLWKPLLLRQHCLGSGA